MSNLFYDADGNDLWGGLFGELWTVAVAPTPVTYKYGSASILSSGPYGSLSVASSNLMGSGSVVSNNPFGSASVEE